MKRDIAEKWIKALRSGEYQQTKNYLQFEGKFCCLGVLCDLAVKENICNFYNNEDLYIFYDKQYNMLPDSVKEWAGMKDSGGRYNRRDSDMSLWRDNDILNKTFDEIADIIEKNIENL